MSENQEELIHPALKQVFGGAFAYILHYRKTLLQALFIPFIVYIVSALIKLLFYYQAYLSSSLLINILFSLTGLAAQVIFAIVTHRIVILGPQSVGPWGITSWSKRETTFVIYFVLLWVLVGILITLFSFHPYVTLIALLLVLWYSSRLFLVFPAIAIDKKISFHESWELTKKCHLFIFLVVVVFPILLAIPNYLTSFLPYTYFIDLLLTPLILVFEIAALSLTYKMITDIASSDSSIGGSLN